MRAEEVERRSLVATIDYDCDDDDDGDEELETLISSMEEANQHRSLQTPSQVPQCVSLLAKSPLFISLWILSLIVADRSGVMDRVSHLASPIIRPTKPSTSTDQGIESISDPRDMQPGRSSPIEDRHDYSRPASINYTAIVQDLDLPKVFSQRFMDTSGIPPWCTYDRKHAESVGFNKNSRPFASGLLYNKNPKAASSTIAGITLRISNNVANRYSLKRRCTSYEHHLTRSGNAATLFGHRNENQSFLFSSVRDPATQSLSHIFFRPISRGGMEPTDANMLNKFLQNTDHQAGAVSMGQGGFQVEYLTQHIIAPNSAWRKEQPNQVLDPATIHEHLRKIFQDYDFFLLVERFDESLVVLQLLLNLETSDILYLSSKKSGVSYGYHPGKRKCVFLEKPFASERVAAYLESDEWYAKQYGDYVLIEAVSQSLDLTIEAIGKGRFHEALRSFLQLKDDANNACAAIAAFPCSSDGVPQLDVAEDSCYAKDWGCGYKCLDDLVAASV